MLDAFWEPKSYATAEEFKEFCNTTVPLARLRQRVFTTADAFDVDVELAHYGAEPMENAKASGALAPVIHPYRANGKRARFPIGKNIPLGKISANLATVGAPGEYKLIVTVAPASFFNAMDRKIVPGPNVTRGVTYFENEWNFWVYPGAQARPSALPPGITSCPASRSADILITSSWDEAEKKLAAGGKVLFVPRNSDLDWTSPPLDTVPVFWNRFMGPAWGRMLGLWIDRPFR